MINLLLKHQNKSQTTINSITAKKYSQRKNLKASVEYMNKKNGKAKKEGNWDSIHSRFEIGLIAADKSCQGEQKQFTIRNKNDKIYYYAVP